MYSQQISRANPGYLLFLLDQSGSMDEPIGNSNGNEKKKDQLALALNKLLLDIMIRSTRSDGVMHYFDISAIGYRTDQSQNPIISSAFGGRLSGRDTVPLSELSDNPAEMKTVQTKVFDEETGEVKELSSEAPVWITPVADGGTPMCNALYRAYELVNAWIENGHQESFPPIVIHITDGESGDGDPIPYADPLKSLSTNDGNVLLFNCHLSQSSAAPFLFPSNGESLPDEFSRLLFEMSSELPENAVAFANRSGFQIGRNARGMSYNADIITLIKFIDIGTRVASLR
jgi:hypothetical protein